MKKYKLLIESPGIAKGSVVMQNDAGFYEIRHELSMYRTIFPDSQVENRPEVWELVEESTIDKTEQGNVYLPFEPGSGEDYCIVDYKGMADMRKNLNQEIGEKHAKQGAFRTEEEALEWGKRYSEAWKVLL